MSQKAISWAVRQTGIPWQSKLMLLLLAYHHDEETGFCIPSKRELAEQSGFTEATAVKYIKYLRFMRLVKKKPRYSENGGQDTNHYWLQMDGEGQ